MNEHERRRKREIGVAFLSELIADVLAQSPANGEDRGLDVDVIRQRAGFSPNEFANQLCRGILFQMKRQDEIEVVLQARMGGPTRWRLKE